MIDRAALRKWMEEMEASNGPFTLFALLKRESTFDEWDLVVAAPWLDGDNGGDLKELIRRFVERFGEKQLQDIEIFVILRPIDESLHNILREVGTVQKKKTVEKTGRELFGLPVEHAYIFRARPQAAA